MVAAYNDPSLIKEVWGLFAVGAAVLLTRLAVRARTVGFRNFCGDDYITVLVLLCYIGDAVTVDRTYFLGTNVDFSQEQLKAMTPQEVHNIVIGSKLELLAWYSYTLLIWALKCCMLFFFGRLTSGLSMQTYVRWLSVVIVLSYIAVFLTISCGCFPIQKNWQVMPDPGLKCTFKPQILYATAPLNIITDIAILITPIPMLWNLEVSRGRKFSLSLLLFPGVFVIAAAVVRVVMSLQASPSAVNINRWGVRETLAGIIAVNIPILRPMLRRSFWRRGAMTTDRSKTPDASVTFGSRRTPKGWTLSSSNAHDRSYDPERQGNVSFRDKSGVAIEMTDHTSECSSNPSQRRSDSEEFIIQRPQAPSRHDAVAGNNGVLVETTFGNTVEYQHEDFRPVIPRGLGREDLNYVRSVSHNN